MKEDNCDRNLGQYNEQYYMRESHLAPMNNLYPILTNIQTIIDNRFSFLKQLEALQLNLLQGLDDIKIKDSPQWKFISQSLKQVQHITEGAKRLTSMVATGVILCNPLMYNMNPMAYINPPQTEIKYESIK